MFSFRLIDISIEHSSMVIWTFGLIATKSKVQCISAAMPLLINVIDINGYIFNYLTL